MLVSCAPGRARSKGSLVAKLFQDVKSAQRPDQPDFQESRSCHMNQRTIMCVLCRRRRLCALGPATAQGVILHDVSNIMIIALEALFQTIQLVLSEPHNMVQCPVSPELRSHYLGWLDMYYDTHHLHSTQSHVGVKGTTDVGIVNQYRTHTSASNVLYQREHIYEKIKCLLPIPLFHRLFKVWLSVGLKSLTSQLGLATLGPIELFVSTHDQQRAYAALLRSVRNTKCSTGNLVTTLTVEIRPRMLQSEGPTIGDGNVPLMARSVSTLRDMEHSAMDHSSQLYSVLQQQDASVQAKVIWPGICGIHWTRESDMHGQSNEMTRNTSLVQNGNETTKQAGGYADQGQGKHQPDTQQRQRSSTWPAMLKRKRRLDSDESQDNDERKGSGPGGSYKRRRADSERTPRFACPFFKYNPSRFAKERVCCGPGWSNVNRVKEHLFRKHSLPKYQCARCFSNFKTTEELAHHHRQLKACEVQDKPSILDGLDQETLSRLKTRLRKPSPISSSFSAEEQKWYTIYTIIFPDHTSVPSPCELKPPSHHYNERSPESTDYHQDYEPEDKGLSLLPSEAVAEEIFRKNLQETLPTWILRDSTIMDSIMHGSISAFNKTFATIHGQGTANIDRRLPVSDEASKTRNEDVDDSFRLSSLSTMTPEENYKEFPSIYDHVEQYDNYTPAQSFTFHQTSGDKAETTEPPVQPPTHIRSWQPGSLPPLLPTPPSCHPDWPFQDDVIGLVQGSEGWAVDRAHLSPSTLGHRDNTLFDLE